MTASQAPLGYVVFVAGISTMAVEMLAARLIAPFYGTSLLVWMLLLASILFALTVGYFRGGRNADLDPTVEPLARTLSLAAALLALLPLLGLWWLQNCGKPEFFVVKVLGALFGGYIATVGGHVCGLIGTVLFLCIPVALLGSVGPYVIRLRADDPALMGRGAGSILGLSTIGSIVGTYLPALIGIPLLGTYRSFLALAILVGTAAVQIAGPSLRPIAFGVAIVLPAILMPLQPKFLRPGEGVEIELESVYNTIQVRRQTVIGDGSHKPYDSVMLILNEGYAVHSITIDENAWRYPLVGSVWDYMGCLPMLSQPEEKRLDVAIVGLAGGTVANEILALYKPFYDVHVEGAEIDPKIIELARSPKYFRLPPEVTAHAQDGRTFLARSRRSYDLIVTDAYRQPYIPFHLTTREYFTLVHDRLKDRGISSINVGATSLKEPLLDKIFATMASVFAEVYIFEVPRVTPLFANYLVVAARTKGVIKGPFDRSRNLAAKVIAKFPGIPLLPVVQTWQSGLLPSPVADPSQLLTDDRAPVESLVHSMIINTITNPGLDLGALDH